MLMRSPFQIRLLSPDGFRAQRCLPPLRLRESPPSIVPLRCACQGIARPCCPLRSTLTVLTSQTAALRNSRSRSLSLRLFEEYRDGVRSYVTPDGSCQIY